MINIFDIVLWGYGVDLRKLSDRKIFVSCLAGWKYSCQHQTANQLKILFAKGSQSKLFKVGNRRCISDAPSACCGVVHLGIKLNPADMRNNHQNGGMRLKTRQLFFFVISLATKTYDLSGQCRHIQSADPPWPKSFVVQKWSAFLECFVMQATCASPARKIPDLRR